MFCCLVLEELVSPKDRRTKMGNATKKKCWIHKLFSQDLSLVRDFGHFLNTHQYYTIIILVPLATSLFYVLGIDTLWLWICPWCSLPVHFQSCHVLSAPWGTAPLRAGEDCFKRLRILVHTSLDKAKWLLGWPGLEQSCLTFFLPLSCVFTFSVYWKSSDWLWREFRVWI